MAAISKYRASYSVAASAVLLFMALLLQSSFAQEPADLKLTVLVPKARQLQHDGDFQAAEHVAQFDLKHQTNLAQLAGGLEVLTSIYQKSGRLEEALTIGERYRTVLETVPGADASKRQDIRLLLGEILAGLKRYPEAIAQVDDSLKIAGGLRTTEVLWEPQTIALRAEIRQAAGQKEAARSDWHKVEMQSRKVLDRILQTEPNAGLEEASLKLLTQSLVSTNRTSEAIAIREQLLSRQLDTLVRAQNWSEIAACYALLEQDAQEEHALREALDLETRHEGLQSQAHEAELMDRLGVALKHQGEAAAAERQWKEAAESYQQLIDRGTGRRRLERQAGYLAKLQTVLERLGEWRDAIAVGERLLERRSKTWLIDDPKLWRLKIGLANLYLRSGDADNARALLNPALEYWRDRTPSSTTELALTTMQLSKVALHDKDYKLARTLAEEAVTAWQKAQPGHELQLAEAQGNLGQVLTEAHHYRSAVQEYEQAIKLCSSLPLDRRTSMLLSGMLVDVAKVYQCQHQFRKAAEYCGQALKIREQAPGKDPMALVGLHLAIAKLRLAAARGSDDGLVPTELAQAEAHIATARKLCAQHGWLDRQAGIEVLQLEAVVDVRRDKPAAARKTLDEALSLSRRSRLDSLEAKIRSQLAHVQPDVGSSSDPSE
jgi:tetratricopeptide (TPR) repeat protein